MGRHRISLDDLDNFGMDRVATDFVKLSEELAKLDESLREPMLFAAKGVMALDKVSSGQYAPSLLVDLRKGSKWMLVSKGKLTEAIARRESNLNVLKSDLYSKAMQTLADKGVKISDGKIEYEIGKDENVREIASQLSVLRAILSHVVDYVDHFKWTLKDVVIQEARVSLQMMKDSAHEERKMSW